MYKFELHLHTADCDRNAHFTGAEAVRLYQDAGYCGVVITDHYFKHFRESFSDELSGASHREFINRWLKGYYSAKNEGEKIGFTVLSGAELRFDNCINDYLIYGADEDFFFDAPLLTGLSGLDELLPLLPDDALVVQAHPFRVGMTVQDPSLLFGIEGFNGGTSDFRNEMAKLYAKHFGKPITSGSDFHKIKSLAAGGIITDEKIMNNRDLVRILRSGNYSLIERNKT